jgi:hypothetical protein
MLMILRFRCFSHRYAGSREFVTLPGAEKAPPCTLEMAFSLPVGLSDRSGPEVAGLPQDFLSRFGI